jgi:beta-glucosidase
MKKAGISHLSLLCLILISLLFVSCQSQSPEQAKQDKQTEQTGQAPVVKGFKAFDAKAKEILSRMTLDEKIGQMTQPEQDKVLANEGDMQKYFIGSVLSGGDSDPARITALSNGPIYMTKSRRALKTRLAIPALYGIDAVHGHSNVLGQLFPT